jgi:hypothetical protein
MLLKSLETQEGNYNNIFPFCIGSSSQRYQQVFLATEFVSLSKQELITQILFRPDAIFGDAFSSTIPDIQINLSTTSAAPDRLSTTFANNVGNDDTVVFNRGLLSLSSADIGPVVGPKEFDIAINLSTSFFFNVNKGNLLLDVRVFAGGFTTTFDAENTLGDSISRVFNNNVNASTGFADTIGLVTKFITTRVS